MYIYINFWIFMNIYNVFDANMNNYEINFASLSIALWWNIILAPVSLHDLPTMSYILACSHSAYGTLTLIFHWIIFFLSCVNDNDVKKTHNSIGKNFDIHTLSCEKRSSAEHINIHPRYCQYKYKIKNYARNKFTLNNRIYFCILLHELIAIFFLLTTTVNLYLVVDNCK